MTTDPGHEERAAAVAVLTDEVRDAAVRSVLCWLATVDTSGQPNVSPKEVFAVVDGQHLAIANIASPTSARNVRARPRVCVSFIDVFVQKGFKVLGTARHVAMADPEFGRWVAALRDRAGPRFTIHGVFLVQALAVEPIVAPSYRLFPGETTETSQVEAALRSYGVTRLRGGDAPTS